MKNISFLYPIALAVVLIIGFYLGLNQNKGSFENRAELSGGQKIDYVLNMVKAKYVDEVDTDKMAENTLISMLENLDPHSTYIPPTDNKYITESLEGQFGGVGIRFMIMDDTLMVTNVVEGGPSEKTGVKAGDRILRIDNDTVVGNGISNDKVIEKLRGEMGTVVTTDILRPETGELLNYKITRGTIPLNSIASSFMLSDKIGYIKLIRFSGSSIREFEKAMGELQSEGMEKLVLDLRNNGGGYLDVAVYLADQFLSDDKLIVYTQGRNNRKQTYNATSSGKLENTNVTVLINSASASASEIVAGAIQDNDRGTIIGRRSFGKGLVQEPIPLSDGSSIRLTISKYYTPTGRCIQKPYTKDYEYEHMMREDANGFTEMDTALIPDSLKFYTEKGKLVYGGGGITPDIIIKNDTSGWTSLYSSILSKNSFVEFAFRNTSKLRKQFKDKSVKEFTTQYFISNTMLTEFKSFIQSKGVKITDEFQTSLKLIKTRLKAEFASNLYDISGYYYVLSNNDDDIRSAINTLK